MLKLGNAVDVTVLSKTLVNVVENTVVPSDPVLVVNTTLVLVTVVGINDIDPVGVTVGNPGNDVDVDVNEVEDPPPPSNVVVVSTGNENVCSCRL